jgi:AraC-like DNA-binding protein
MPCYIYIESGLEVLTNCHQDVITLTEGTSIFLPQGLNLNSDFVKEANDLKAMIVFFDNEIITDYLNHIKIKTVVESIEKEYCVLERNTTFERYFSSINYCITDDLYKIIKFKELLHLIVHADRSNIIVSLLATMLRLPPKKNLRRLLESIEVVNLSVNELAHISGRSLSSFNREFKAIYQTTAKKWLLEKRLSKAKELVESESYSITDIAMMVGYSNVSHFIKVFKSKYGQTPKLVKSSR